jgi:hypothetical protein
MAGLAPQHRGEAGSSPFSRPSLHCCTESAATLYRLRRATPLRLLSLTVCVALAFFTSCVHLGFLTNVPVSSVARLLAEQPFGDSDDGGSVGGPSPPALSVRALSADGRRNGPYSYFVALNLYNNEDILPLMSDQLLLLAHSLGASNVFISVFENGASACASASAS